MKTDKNTKKILITGSNGYIGSNLKAYFQKRSYIVYGIEKSKIGSSKNEYLCDVTNLKQINNIVLKLKPTIIIHTAGLSNLNECEKNPKIAYAINTNGTENIVKSIKVVNPNTKLIFFSSDYVFVGDKGNYKETDKTEPKTIYGKSKLQAEDIIKQQLKNYIICRTANVYGRGGNFFNFISSAIKRNEKIEAFDDVYFTPTFIDSLIEAINILIKKNLCGTFHIVGDEIVSRYTFALKIAKAFKRNEKLIMPIPKPKHLFIAKNSSLNNNKIKSILGINFPNIEKNLKNLTLNNNHEQKHH